MPAELASQPAAPTHSRPLPPVPSTEARRLDALRRYGILDTAPEKVFDDTARVASAICGTPIALMSLVDGHRQWFKARVGLDVTETPREHAFCAYTIMSANPLVVENATEDARFSENPHVIAAPNIRFYARAPIIDQSGNALGSLCVIDDVPRRLESGQIEALEALARGIAAHIELRKVSADLAAALEELKTIQGLLPICSHCKDVRDDDGYWKKVENYLRDHSEAKLTHGVCPGCAREHYPEVYEKLRAAGVSL